MSLFPKFPFFYSPGYVFPVYLLLAFSVSTVEYIHTHAAPGLIV